MNSSASFGGSRTNPAEPQVKRAHYFKKKYVDLNRFISYFYQLDLLGGLLRPGVTVLEVGVGNRIVSDYLKRFGIPVTTCDVDPALEPDRIGDIRNLPFPDQSFDIVIAFEVLEHLPFGDFRKALAELKRVSRDAVLLSLPYRSSSFEVVLKFPFVRTLFRRPVLDFFIRIPLPFQRTKASEQHFWEIDRAQHPLREIQNILEEQFVIHAEVRPLLDSYHYFFVLKRR